MPLWKIAFLSYAVLRLIHSAQALAKIVQILSFTHALKFLKGWRIYADTAFTCAVFFMAFDIAIFDQLVWAFVFLLAVFTAMYDLFIYPKEIASEPNVNGEFLKRSKLLSFANFPIYGAVYIYAFLSPHIWSKLA